jgi:hypothetical protein
MSSNNKNHIKYHRKTVTTVYSRYESNKIKKQFNFLKQMLTNKKTKIASSLRIHVLQEDVKIQLTPGVGLIFLNMIVM